MSAQATRADKAAQRKVGCQHARPRQMSESSLSCCRLARSLISPYSGVKMRAPMAENKLPGEKIVSPHCHPNNVNHAREQAPGAAKVLDGPDCPHDAWRQREYHACEGWRRQRVDSHQGTIDSP